MHILDLANLMYINILYFIHVDGGNMARTSIPTLNLEDYLSGDEQRRSHFIQALGDALTDIGFFALTGHGIGLNSIQNAYQTAKDFFSLSDEIKEKYEEKQGAKERGFIPFGVEHAKNNPSPDLKEFWQTGRTLNENHPKYVQQQYQPVGKIREQRSGFSIDD